MFVGSSGLVVGRSAIVAMANPLEICCAHACAIGTAALPKWRAQHASSRIPIALQNPDAT